MKYEHIVKGKFLKRPNRFISHCQVGDEEVLAHVKNTGRCAELLQEGVTVYLEYAPSPTRKTDYSLIGVIKGDKLINMDAQAPNLVAVEGIKEGKITLPNLTGNITHLRQEVTFEGSRFDIYLETDLGEKAFIEVKGVTLEQDNVVKFPDAPTVRGAKHVKTLIKAVESGYGAYVLFIVQMADVSYFTPNGANDPAFEQILLEAKKAGVAVLAYDTTVTPEQLVIRQAVPVKMLGSEEMC